MTPSTTVEGWLCKRIESEASAGDAEGLFESWREAPFCELLSISALRHAIDMLAARLGTEGMLQELVNYINIQQNTPKATMHVLAAMTCSRSAAEIDMFWKKLTSVAAHMKTDQIYDLLLRAYAGAGDVQRVAATVEDMTANGMVRTELHFESIIKGFSSHGLVDAVREQLLDVAAMNVVLRTSCVVRYLRIASDAGHEKLAEARKIIKGLGPRLSTGTIDAILSFATRFLDRELLHFVCSLVEERRLRFTPTQYEHLLKSLAHLGDEAALTHLHDMQAKGVSLPTASWMAILTRCADPKFITLAEGIIEICRKEGTTSIAMYSLLMKVYAFAGLPEKACDLYQRVLDDGLEPDATMYGCLIRFASESGRQDLFQELSEKTPAMAIPTYVTLIQAAGRRKDTSKVMELYAQFKEAYPTSNIMPHNCTIEALVTAGEVERAIELSHEIEKTMSLDVITFNTLLKGMAKKGDFDSVLGLVQTMKKRGLDPNSITYTGLIGAAMARRNYDVVWTLIDEMEKRGVAKDTCMVPALLKPLKTDGCDASVAHKAMEVLDRLGIEVSENGVAVSFFLDICTQHRMQDRFEKLLASLDTKTTCPGTLTYGHIIRACSNFNYVDKCWFYWDELTKYHCEEPLPGVLHAMLDALVAHNQAEAALALFYKWAPTVTPNQGMVSTLIKGLVAGHLATECLEFWRYARKVGVPMSLIMYNRVIDCHARVGAMEAMEELLEGLKEDNFMVDQITLATIIKGFSVQGDVDQALKLFLEFPFATQDPTSYNTLLDGCVRHSRFDLADKLFEEKERLGVIPSNYTVGILVNLNGRRRSLDKAFEIVAELPKAYGFEANVEVRIRLMYACLHCGDIVKAFKVVDDMRAHKQTLTPKAFSALVCGCTRLGEFEHAISLIRKVYLLKEVGGFHGLPNPEHVPLAPIENLIRTLVNRGMAASHADVLRQELLSRGVRVNLKENVPMQVNGRWAH